MMMKLEEIAKRRRKGKHTPFRNKSDTKFLLIFSLNSQNNKFLYLI